MGKDENEFIK